MENPHVAELGGDQQSLHGGLLDCAVFTVETPVSTTSIFVSAGEALIDLIQGKDGRFEACLGGSVFNFAMALARQGVPSAYANPLSEDTFGQRFRARLQQDGVALLSPEPVIQPTSLAVVTVDGEGKPSYAFHRSHVADRSFDEARLLPLLAPAQALHLGCAALVPADVDRYLELVRAVAAHGGIVSMDANLRPNFEADFAPYRASANRALREAHILKVSDEDLVNLGRARASDDEAGLVAASRALLVESPRTQLVALTLGAKGAALISRGASVMARPVPDTVVADTVGAGDCFIAALNATLWRRGAFSAGQVVQTPELLAEALARGIAGATINIGRVGCNPGTWDEVSQVMGQVAVHPLP